MKRLKTTTKTLTALCLAMALNACAGDDAEFEDEFEVNGAENSAEVYEDEYAEEGEFAEENEYAEHNGGNENWGNEGTNNFAGENWGNEGTNNFASENWGNETNVANGTNLMNDNPSATGDDFLANEFINNAAGENFLNAGTGDFAAEEPMADPTANAALMENSTEDLGFMADNGIVEVNQNTAMQGDPSMGATDTSMAAPQESAVPMTGGQVHYVMSSGTSGYDSPSGQVVRTYEQGDHPLVTAEGEWVRTSDGAYLSSSALTTRPVSRAKSPKSWQ